MPATREAILRALLSTERAPVLRGEVLPSASQLRACSVVRGYALQHPFEALRARRVWQRAGARRSPSETVAHQEFINVCVS